MRGEKTGKKMKGKDVYDEKVPSCGLEEETRTQTSCRKKKIKKKLKKKKK